MQQPRQSTLPVIPEIRARINLSPFTWNHLTLPPLMKTYNSIQIKPSLQKGEDRLATINEARLKIKNVSSSSKKQKSNHQKPYSQEKYINKNLISGSSQQMQKQKNEINKKQTKKQLNKTIDFLHNIKKKQRIKSIEQTPSTQRQVNKNFLRNGWRYGKQAERQENQFLMHDTSISTDCHQGKIQSILDLTRKDYLHQSIQANSKQFYPLSFLIPKDYEAFTEQNNKIAVKSMLRRVSIQILQYFHSQNMKDDSWSDTKVHIGDILQSVVINKSSENCKILVKMCMFLQNIRVQQNYYYFQNFPSYVKINIKPKTHFFDNMIKYSVNYLDEKVDLFLQIKYRSIDFRLLVLILHYDSLFKQYEGTYDSPHQFWIVKPFVSSKKNDVTIIKSTSQLCSLQEYNFEFKIKKKYENKIIQKYIINPYLLNTPSAFSQRKFIIKQWVLLIGSKKNFSIYKYQTAYCLFASQKYNCGKLQRGMYQMDSDQLQQNNVMMIQELFQVCRQDLRAKYSQQSVEIIKTVMNKTKSSHFVQQSQLFVLDFLLGSNSKLYILGLNIYGNKNKIKHQKLQKQSQVMIKAMKQLVETKKNNEKWFKLLGSDMKQEHQQILPLDQIQIKPFYKCTLEQGQSLIQLIRQRIRIFSKLATIIKIFMGKRFLNSLKKYQKPVLVLQEKLKQQLNIKNQYCKSNEVYNQGQIRFIQERQLSNI